tara:strand:+ start:152 stop:268 length:117 start_codon:yes stop_codon:yes gene_type:complete
MEFVEQYFEEAKQIIDSVDRKEIIKMVTIINEVKSKDK